MTDYFALFGQPRQPHLDANALEESFHRLARALHPDASSSGDAEAFQELNRARKEMGRDRSSNSAITNSVAHLQRTEIRMQLSGLVHELECEQARARDELIQLDLLWNQNRAAAIAGALRLLQQFAFLRKWLDTLHELQFQLAN